MPARQGEPHRTAGYQSDTQLLDVTNPLRAGIEVPGSGDTGHRLLGTFTADSREIINKRSDNEMDKDRIEGAAKEAKGTVKEAVGKAIGDTKLTAEGKSDKTEGKIQNAIGGVKDALKE
jgi:uncharacterized protein YjbJ (UPF0337 family)